MSQPYHAYIESIKFTDNTELSFDKGSIVVITGPNNSGKSSTLATIYKKLDLVHTSPNISGPTLKFVRLGIEGDEESYIEFLKHRYKYIEKEDKIDFGKGYQGRLQVNTLVNRFRDRSIPNQILNDHTLRLTAQNRLGGNEYRGGLTRAARDLYYDKEKEIHISQIFRRAFGIDLILDRTSDGGEFRIADRSKLPQDGSLFTKESRTYFDSLPEVFQQGDGVKSFSRILLEVMIGDWNVIVIDEPELFLHPPQIRQLAKLIAEDTPKNTQIFTATHSDQFVKNLVEFATDRIQIVRLTRSEKLNHATRLDSDEIRQLLSDPIINSSGVLNALFHEGAILCEGDSDLTFFQAIREARSDNDKQVDVEFFHAGGKDRIVKITDALRSLKINVAAIVDIDILRDTSSFQNLVKSFGIDYELVKNEISTIHSHINGKRSDITINYFRSEVLNLTEKLTGSGSVPKEVTDQVSALLRRASPWSAIKDQGATWFSGGVYRAVCSVIDVCAKHGLFIVPVGELEGFCRSAQRRSKLGWLTESLSKDLDRDPELENARQFVARVMSYFE